MRALLSAAMLLLCGALLFGVWHFGMRVLSDLPGRTELRRASADAAATSGARANADGGTARIELSAEPDARLAAAPAARGDPATSAAPSGPQERSGDVRFIEKDGIVGVHITGPLERAPAKVEPAPVAPPPGEQPDLYRLVVIESADLINARSHKIRLAHVNAPALEATCRRADGVQWPCGRRARTAMRRLIRRRAIECVEDEVKEAAAADAAPPAMRAAECAVANVDLSRWLVEQGWASPSDTAPEDWAALHEAAKGAGLGLYATDAR